MTRINTFKAGVCALAVSGLFAPASPASADEPVELPPTSNWNLRYDKEACRLVRTFGEGRNEVVLILVKYTPGTEMEIIASGIPLKNSKSNSFHFGFDPQESRDIETPLFGETENGGTIWQFSSGLIPNDQLESLKEGEASREQLKTAEMSAAATIGSVTFLRGIKQPVRLRTGKLTGALKAMDNCLNDLVKSWGLDPLEQATLISEPKPKGSPGSWIRTRDYPQGALRNSISGNVRFRLQVTSTGDVDQCIVQSSYSDPAFPNVVCNKMKKRAKFEPARNANGEAVDSYWASAVTFKVY